MSYQVLARKWRPRNFSEMVGQGHVLQALTNALDSDRLHHAYLFTGTRGVGKTTVARIFAKALNCEQGVSAEPCCECSSCKEIDEGRFIDLIEVDAASRTKVDETRELLENVQYTPSRGRYKVYLIDEVHMFSNHSFNALLKTLEEPPPHVKFLLATTDPKKLPVTILSRCLQFNLKRLSQEQIEAHLRHLLQEESISNDEASVKMLAKAADGSLRDALSLLDQSIAYGGGSLEADNVSTMLGTIDRDSVFLLLQALTNNDPSALMMEVARLAELSVDFSSVLDELLAVLQQIAILQVVNEHPVDDERLREVSKCVSADDIQLYYQIGIIGRRDLPLSPQPRGGFEMVMLRMLTFSKDDSADAASPTRGQKNVESKPRPVQTKASPEPASAKDPVKEQVLESHHTQVKEPVVVSNIPGNNWIELIDQMQLTGLDRELASNCSFVSHEGNHFKLNLLGEKKHVLNDRAIERLQKNLQEIFDATLKLSIDFADSLAEETPVQIRDREAEERQKQAVESITNDPMVQSIQESFGATVVSDSIKPV